MNTTPEWKSTPGMIRDENAITQRSKAKKRGRTIKRIAIYLALAAAGFGIGTVGAALTSPDADAVSQVTINKYIRAHGGIPPCTHEDGSGQPGVCYWDASERGVKGGYDYVAISKKHSDDRIVYLTGPKAKRY
jgi:hypothetical protein